MRKLRHLQLFCGIGGLSAGISDSVGDLAGRKARWKCVAAVDSDRRTVEEYCRYTQSNAGVVADLFSRDQYVAYHGQEPPRDWVEVVPAMIRSWCGDRPLDLVASSPPCRGYTGLIGKSKAATAKYQALNSLYPRALELVWDAFPVPPKMILCENVPGVRTRGSDWLDEVIERFKARGYAVVIDDHCLGRVGGLGARRPRCLLLARHKELAPSRVLLPVQRRLKSVGEVLGQLPMPGDPAAGRLHRPRRTSWKTSVRLALIPPGKDWRALRDLRVEDGVVQGYRIVPAGSYHGGSFGVTPWDAPCPTITTKPSPSSSGTSIADPRPGYVETFGQLGVVPWGSSGGTIRCGQSAGQGPVSIQDPRPCGTRHNNVFRVVAWPEPSTAITSGSGPSAGGNCIQDPRVDWHPGAHRSKYRITKWEEPSGVVAGDIGPASGGLAVADPMSDWMRRREGSEQWVTGGHFGVVDASRPAGTVTASACHDNGPWSVADARVPEDADTLGVWVILSQHDTGWHRPMTLLERAALMGLVVPESLDDDAKGGALLQTTAPDTAVAQFIGNAVPRPAAAAIGTALAEAILAGESDEPFRLSARSTWCRPLALISEIAG